MTVRLTFIAALVAAHQRLDGADQSVTAEVEVGSWHAVPERFLTHRRLYIPRDRNPYSSWKSASPGSA